MGEYWVNSPESGLTFDNAKMLADYATHLVQQERERCKQVAIDHAEGSERLAEMCDKAGDIEGRKMHRYDAQTARSIAAAPEPAMTKYLSHDPMHFPPPAREFKADKPVPLYLDRFPDLVEEPKKEEHPQP